FKAAFRVAGLNALRALCSRRTLAHCVGSSHKRPVEPMTDHLRRLRVLYISVTISRLVFTNVDERGRSTCTINLSGLGNCFVSIPNLKDLPMRSRMSR